MLGSVLQIVENSVIVKLNIDITKQPNLVGIHVIFEDGTKKVVGEIESANKETLKVNIVGEFTDRGFLPGIATKPSFKSTIRIINANELTEFLGNQEISDNEAYLGISNIYDNYKVSFKINSFFSNHFSILGNSGSGKSYTVAGILQRVFNMSKTPPVGAHFFLFDAYGEYTEAFSNIHQINHALNYKVYTTNTKESKNDTILRIPIWLLDVDDLALLLDATTPNQLPIIEKTLKLVPILSGNDQNVIKHKNDIIARALLDILLSGNDSTKIRDQVIAVLTKFHTDELNLDSKISQPGYVRTLNQCLYIDKLGKIQEMELVVEFISSFIDNSLTLEKQEEYTFYNLSDLENAMDFALISEGILKSDKVFDMANVLMVRLHTLANSEQSTYFDYPRFVNREEYIKDLVTTKNGEKCQIVNFNINYVDDRIAKVIAKIISRMIFKQATSEERRGINPYHIIIEEAHRYVQKDNDINILGYNIFDRITKEGRKYGVILGLITQRPSELSETAISQCSNFIILRMSHPLDLDYIRKMVPNVSQEIVDKLKNLKPGYCIAFGSAFKVPIYAHVESPNPPPISQNVDIVNAWKNSPEQKTFTSFNFTSPIEEISIDNTKPVMISPIPSPSDISYDKISEPKTSSVFRSTQE